MHLSFLISKGAGPILRWQGWLDSNQRMRESKSLALPLGDTPVWKRMRDRDTPDPSFLFVGWVKGLEPSTPGTTIRCSNQLSYTHHIYIRTGRVLTLQGKWHARRDSNPWPTA